MERPQPRSLDEVHRSVPIPDTAGFKRRLFAFMGPAYLVSVGYMDPGNWATDIEGGARFGYQLIWVLLMSNLMAILLQTLSARLGLVAERDLAQACRDQYPPPVTFLLWVLCEIAIAACDLAEVLGTAIGLNLLFGLPLIWGVVITGFDALVLLVLQRFGIRKMEALILVLISTIGLCFLIEVFLSKPDWGGIALGFVPRLNGESLYIAIGILGATVMPHNLYLHSALVQSRDVRRDSAGLRQACRYNLFDSALALNLAFLVNAAILVVAAADFFRNGILVTEIQQAHSLLNDILGTQVAPVAFAVALICAGQSSTLTGTLAGQIVMEGFLDLRLRPWIRRLITRLIAVVPAVVVIVLMGDEGTYRLLILSQVILSLQLPFAIVPLIKFTSDKVQMGEFTNPVWLKTVSWATAAVIIGLNAQLVVEELRSWVAAAGELAWLVQVTVIPVSLGLAGLLVYMTFRAGREEPVVVPAATAELVLRDAFRASAVYRRVGVALDATPDDSEMLAEALATVRANNADLVLLHVVEGVGGQFFGSLTAARESRHDFDYLRELETRLSESLGASEIRIEARLGYGQPAQELVRMARAEKLDLLIMGGHGHRVIRDLLHGETISRVRHELDIPIVAVGRRRKHG